LLSIQSKRNLSLNYNNHNSENQAKQDDDTDIEDQISKKCSFVYKWENNVTLNKGNETIQNNSNNDIKNKSDKHDDSTDNVN